MKDVFASIYTSNFWNGDEGVSGQGSSMQQTVAIRGAVPGLLKMLNVKTLLDIPCGDFNWIPTMLPELGLDKYIGADIVPELVEKNRHDYTVPGEAIYFEVLDASADRLPKVDMILCRDMLGHFNNKYVRATLKNFQASGSTWLLATTFPGRNPNADIETGEWRPIDLEALRYGLGPAQYMINERSTVSEGKFADKSLGLWRLN